MMTESGNELVPEEGLQGNVAVPERGPQRNLSVQLQCRASSSAEEVRKLLEEKLNRHLDGYTLVFNNSEVYNTNDFSFVLRGCSYVTQTQVAAQEKIKCANSCSRANVRNAISFGARACICISHS